MKRKPDTFTGYRAIMDNRGGEGLGIWCHIYLVLIDSWISLSSLSLSHSHMHMHWHAQWIRRTFHYQYCWSSSSLKWHLEEAVIMARDVLKAGCERRRYQESFWYLDSSVWPRKAIEIVCWMCTQYLVMRWHVNFVFILLACNSGTARWKFFCSSLIL